MSYTEQDARDDITADDAKKFLCLCEDEDILEYLIREHISVKDLVIAIANTDDKLHKRTVEAGNDAFGELIFELLNEHGEMVKEIYNQSMKISEEKK